MEGGKASLYVAALTGAVGILIGVLALTGIGIRFSYILVDVAGKNLPIALLLLAVATLVLGLALPITATYLMVAVVAVPFLTDLGLAPLTAHLIILWLSLDANITPPVALGPFAAAAIAEADPMKTGWACFRFAKVIYLMPVLFAYTHILLTGTPAQNLWAILSVTLGVILFSIVSTRSSWKDDAPRVPPHGGGDGARVPALHGGAARRRRDLRARLLLAAPAGRRAAVRDYRVDPPASLRRRSAASVAASAAKKYSIRSSCRVMS